MNMTTIIDGESNRQQPPTSSGFGVDVTRGERIGRVSSEWFTRPEDERFLNLLHAPGG